VFGSDPALLRAFADGVVIRAGRSAAPPQERTLLATDHRGRVKQRWQVPVATAVRQGTTTLGGAVVSYDAAERLGLVTGYATMVATTNHPVTDEALDRLAVRGIYAWSHDPQRVIAQRLQFAGLGVAGLLSILVVGVAVAMTAAESRDDVATLAAVGAGPGRRRAFGAMHGLFLGLVGSVLGVVVGVPAGMAFTQVDGAAGVDVPWLASVGTVLVVLAAAPLVGWLVTPSKLRLTRRTA
jgi:putative ABC transport system permease protein